jgi:CRISPR-associated protein Cmr1
LLTHQYGGGAISGETDKDQWLRPSAVRGALRFWWRAIYSSCEDIKRPEDLLLKEESLFGGVSGDCPTPGNITVDISEQQNSNKTVTASSLPPVFSVAYFSARLGQGQDAPLLVPGGYAATIRIQTPEDFDDDLFQEVQNAMFAFLLFGGSGSRTRRASGSFHVTECVSSCGTEFPKDLDTLRVWFKGLPRGMPAFDIFSIGEAELYYKENCSHQCLLEFWREFRQDRPHPKSWEGPRGWGQTRWPDADAIRFASGDYLQKHKPKDENKGKVPRSHLGQPMIVKFKDKGDPLKTTIGDRYSSPVILSLARLSGVAEDTGFVLITKSILKPEEPVESKSDFGEELKPGNWDVVLDKLKAKLETWKFTNIKERNP